MHLTTITTDEHRQEEPLTTATAVALARWGEPTSTLAPSERCAPSTWSSREAHPSWPGWKWHALHDPITGVGSRRLIDERLREAMRSGAGTDAPVTVLFFDIDGFREINCTLGHVGGDHVLRVVASRLVNESRSADTVGRLYGDAFVVVMEAAPGRVAWAAAERMRKAISDPIVIPEPLASGLAVTVTVSVGVARAGNGHPQRLLHRSDLAMYTAKAQGGDRVVLAEPARPWAG